MERLRVRSRNGNVVLAAVGVLYTAGAAIALISLVRQAWDAAGLLDMLLQAAMLWSIGCGIWFVRIAMESLGVRLMPTRGRRTVSAVPS
jgi:hypothetical protein